MTPRPESRTNAIGAKVPAAVDKAFRAKCVAEGINVQETLNRLVKVWSEAPVGWWPVYREGDGGRE